MRQVVLLALAAFVSLGECGRPLLLTSLQTLAVHPQKLPVSDYGTYLLTLLS